MTKEEILKYAKVKNAPKGYVHRFKNDEPLTPDDLKWALNYRVELSYEVYLRAMKLYGMTLELVPENHRTYELCFEAVKKKGWTLEHVPEKHKTYELCFAAVNQYGRAIKFVPKELRTYKLCMVAVQQNSFALLHVPEEHRQQIKQELN